MLYLWSGRQDFDETLVQQCMNMLKDSIYFQPDKYRPFLFHPVAEEEIIKDEEKIMEVNEMLSFAEKFFPEEAGLYKKGARFEQKIALLHFHFPAVALKKFANLIREFEQKTGWKAETNTQHNQVAVEALLFKMLGEENHLIQKIAFHPLDNIVKVTLAKKPSRTEELEKEFVEITGIPIVLDYPGRSQTGARTNNSLEIHVDLQGKEPMEQNEAFNLIQQTFSFAPHSLYKKSLKSDEQGKYIELSFISPMVAEKYISWLRDLSKETGWRIKINPIPNQKEIIQAAIMLLNRHDIVLKKNPSILQTEKKARVKLTQLPDSQIWESIQNKFNEMTGFHLEYIL